MCFKNLPVEFDEQGKARLKQGVTDPYAYQVRELTPLDQVLGAPADVTVLGVRLVEEIH